MSSKTKEHRTTGPHAASTTPAEAAETQLAESARHQKIRIRAYELYLDRGEQTGHELEHWLQAERELTTTQPSSLVSSATRSD